MLDGPSPLVVNVLAQLPPFYARGGQPSFQARLSVADGLAAVELEDGLSLTGPDGPEMHRAFASRIELALVDRLPELVAVHAGVVATAAGAIVLPGRSMAGKSTLVQELVRQGAIYLSDEFALLTLDGRVHPYPRAMTLRAPGGSVRSVPDAAAAVDAGPVPVAVIALLQHDAEAGWVVEEPSPGQATMGLVDNCVCIRRRPGPSLTALTAVAQTARLVSGTRGDAPDAAGELLGLLGVASD